MNHAVHVVRVIPTFDTMLTPAGLEGNGLRQKIPMTWTARMVLLFLIGHVIGLVGITGGPHV
jgi:hypothetical protein